MKLKNNLQSHLAFAILLLTAGLAISCKPSATKEAPANLTISGNLITVPDHSVLKGKLKAITVEEEPYSLRMSTTGSVKAIPTQYADVPPLFRVE